MSKYVYTGKPNSKVKLKHSMPRKMVKKAFYTCVGGPLSGQKLYLECPQTLTFTMGGQTGCYSGSPFEWKQQ
jgi:hypothetical protein